MEVTATTYAPAATADATPAGASSNAMHLRGGTPSRSAARRYGSGCGFPCVTSSAQTITPGGSKPAAARRTFASCLVADVTIATSHPDPSS
ncbi:MAG TPA: hypothetical protein VN969_43285 [Streptosporangiaceae bacterium]|nr:hypothetical protein [Streptosporangiaceae bacterium]